MLGTLTIQERFNGPPGSANGGYAAGRIAAFVDAPAVSVRLSAPPPLGVALEAHAVDGGAELRDGDTLLATARPADLEVHPPLGVDPVAAAAAAQRATWTEEVHPYPTCFGCGPLRERGDALRHMCGAVGGEGVVACPATTDARLPHDDEGHLLPEVVWAALDCPSATAVVPVGSPPHLLGTLTVRIERPVRVGEPHVCVAWPLGVDGRKKRAASALLDATGRTCAVAEALWIEVRR